MPVSTPPGIRRPAPQGHSIEALTGVLLGCMLLWLGAQSGVLVGPLCAVPGLLLLGAAMGLLLWPGDVRLPQFLSIGAGLTLLPVIALLLRAEWVIALLLLALGGVVWVVAGRISLHDYPLVEGAPEPARDLPAALRIGTDQALLAWFKIIIRPPRDDRRQRMLAEIEAWEKQIPRGRVAAELWHPQPPDLLRAESRPSRLWGREFRTLSWDSECPDFAELPGGAEWTAHQGNQRAHAWILEHPGKPRPWLLTIHGYRMGSPFLDLRAFEPAVLHERWGLNMASVVLPLHGPRRRGWISGGGYLEGDFSAFIHAERQAQWDIRRLLSWLRLNRHAPRIGVYGLSLGGYNAALLSGLDADLSCVVAGIPVFDMAQTLWRHMPLAERRGLENDGVTEDRVRSIFRPVHPGSYAPRVPAAALGIFAGSIDTLVWPDQPLQLAAHWSAAAPRWYPGAHLTFTGTPAMRDCLKHTLRAGGLLAETSR